jgi:hypothetical protein
VVVVVLDDDPLLQAARPRPAANSTVGTVADRSFTVSPLHGIRTGHPYLRTIGRRGCREFDGSAHRDPDE